MSDNMRPFEALVTVRVTGSVSEEGHIGFAYSDVEVCGVTVKPGTHANVAPFVTKEVDVMLHVGGKP